jgi:hypothetical protein
MPSIPPAGYSPASAFDLVGHAEAPDPVAILADEIDPTTGDFASVDRSASIADGLVITLLRTKRGSGAAVLEFGQRFSELRHMTADAPILAESLAREALAPATDAGVVGFRELVATANDRDPTQLDTSIEYLDLLAPEAEREQSLEFSA